MRLFEIAAVCMMTAAWFVHLLPRRMRRRWQALLPSVVALMAVVLLSTEGYQWQLAPVYLLAFLLFILSMPRLLRSNAPAAKKAGLVGQMAVAAGIFLLSMLVMIAIVLPLLFPTFPLPEPTGAYAVGSASFEWVDESRPESFTDDPTDHRDLMIYVWYPADKAGKGKGNGTEQSLPLAVTPKPFPVLVFSHGYGLAVTNSLAQMHELASHGYVIFGIDHPYEASQVTYPDGRAVPMSQNALNSLSNSSLNKKAGQVLQQCLDATDPAAKDRLFRQYDALAGHSAQKGLQTWTADTVFVLDQITQLNSGKAPSGFAGKLDLERVGVFGHSFGGTTAVKVCMMDGRLKAGVNMDGAQFGQVEDLQDKFLQQPLMEMTSDEGIPGINDFMFARVANWTYRVKIKGSRHQNFTDIPLYAPFLYRTERIAGAIDPKRMETIVNRYLLAFFDKYLKGIDSRLLSGSIPAFPEAMLTVGKPRTGSQLAP